MYSQCVDVCKDLPSKNLVNKKIHIFNFNNFFSNYEKNMLAMLTNVG